MKKVRIVADSLAPSGHRLTTYCLTYQRFFHSELMTHRAFSRNAASSRAIPIEKVLSAVWNNPAMPEHWGKNQSGMQARAELSGWRRWLAIQLWLLARLPSLAIVWLMARIGLHKQISNRLLEPWQWITVIVSATDWKDFFAQRCHPDAQPEFYSLANWMLTEMKHHRPRHLEAGEYHLPFIDDVDIATLQEHMLPRVSVGRCAAVSYHRQGIIREHQKDVELSDRLQRASPAHASPFEHVALASNHNVRSGNFEGFVQYRKLMGL